jgi:2-oxoglutarate dehydrogenase E1 component
LQAVLDKYKNAKEFIWVQEESENMGAWRHVDYNLRNLNLKYVGRDAAASPATGFSKRHNMETEMIMNAIFSKVLVK